MITLPKTVAGKSLLVLGIGLMVLIVVASLCSTQIFNFMAEGFHYSSEREADEQLVRLQTAVDQQCGVGIAVVNRENFWTELPRRPEYGWSNDQITCHGDDRLKENQIQCTCSK